jgi:hypothetical protein
LIMPRISMFCVIALVVAIALSVHGAGAAPLTVNTTTPRVSVKVATPKSSINPAVVGTTSNSARNNVQQNDQQLEKQVNGLQNQANQAARENMANNLIDQFVGDSPSVGKVTRPMGPTKTLHPPNPCRGC